MIKEEVQNPTSNNWETITVDDVKKAFPNKSFEDGGIVDDSYSKSKSIVIPDVDTAVEILKYLNKKMYPYGIGGEPEDIKKVWDRFPESTVKMALPMFRNDRYKQIISFVFDDDSQYPPVFAYRSNYTESPSIWKRLSNASWQGWGKDELGKFFKETIK